MFLVYGAERTDVPVVVGEGAWMGRNTTEREEIGETREIEESGKEKGKRKKRGRRTDHRGGTGRGRRMREGEGGLQLTLRFGRL